MVGGRRLLALAATIGLVVTSAYSQTQPAVEVPSIPPAFESLSFKVHRIIQHSERQHADLVEALQNVCSHGDELTKANIPQAELDVLVDGLLAGDTDDRILHIRMSEAHARSSDFVVFDPNAKPRLPPTLTNVPRYLWSKALAIANTDPKGAERYARAAILCAAYDGFDFGTGVYALVHARDGSFEQVAGLDPAQAKALETLADERQSLVSLMLSARRAIQYDIDLWIDEKTGILSPERRKSLVSRINELWVISQANQYPRVASDTTNLTWDFLNLARSREDQETVKDVLEMYRNWKRELTDPDMLRWIDEAMATQGPPPTRMLHIFGMDGKEVTDPTIRARIGTR